MFSYLLDRMLVICGMKTVEKTCGMVDKMWNANCGTAGWVKVCNRSVAAHRPGSRSRSRKSWAVKCSSRVARAAQFSRLYRRALFLLQQQRPRSQTQMRKRHRCHQCVWNLQTRSYDCWRIWSLTTAMEMVMYTNTRRDRSWIGTKTSRFRDQEIVP